MGVVGVAAGDGDGTPLPAAELRLLETLVAQTALALERARLAEESASARVAFEAERTRSALLRTVSHDLRTPLASVRGAAEVLLEPGQGPTDPAQREMLETIRDEARRLTRLVNDLLDLTRLESETFRVRKEWCPVEEIVGSALGRMEEAVKGRDVRVDLPGDLLMVPVDIVLVEQVLMNLLDNATRYSPAGSPVEIRARAAPGAVFVEVLDRGPGIPPGLERRIFEPFFRAGGGAGAEGTGLGLAVCEAVMRVHGGAIEALARDGGGTVMRFTFPAEGAAPPVEEAA
jgi:two-component system sensor histidine kinase KdpD